MDRQQFQRTQERRVERSYPEDEREMRWNFDYSGYGPRARETYAMTDRRERARREPLEERRGYRPGQEDTQQYVARARMHREYEPYTPDDHWEQNPYDLPRGDRPYHRDLRDSRWSPGSEPEGHAWGYGSVDHVGRGPRGYRRSDARVHEDVCDRLFLDPAVDARQMDVRVLDGRVILDGWVETPRIRRRVVDLVDAVPGVMEIVNRLDVERER